jgi:hypothetical protein
MNQDSTFDVSEHDEKDLPTAEQLKVKSYDEAKALVLKAMAPAAAEPEANAAPAAPKAETVARVKQLVVEGMQPDEAVLETVKDDKPSREILKALFAIADAAVAARKEEPAPATQAEQQPARDALAEQVGALVSVVTEMVKELRGVNEKICEVLSSKVAAPRPP